MDFNSLKNSMEEKGKDELSRREQQIEENLKKNFGGGSSAQADSQSTDLSSDRDVNGASKEIREPMPVDSDQEIEEPEDSEEISAESDEDIDAVSDDETISSDEESEKAA